MKINIKKSYGWLFGVILFLVVLFILSSNVFSDAIDTSLGIIDPPTTVPVLGGGAAALSRLGFY